MSEAAPTRPAVVVDLAAFRARRRAAEPAAEQPSLFETAEPTLATAQPAARRLNARAVAHRARMLAHLKSQSR
jgi:hypothetical protein